MPDEPHGKHEPFQALINHQARCIGEARSIAKSGQDHMARWPAIKAEIDKTAIPRLQTTLEELRQAARSLRRKEPRAKKLPMLIKEIKKALRLGNAIFLHPAILSVRLRIVYVRVAILRLKIRLWLDESRVTPRGLLLLLLLFSIPVLILLFF